MQQVPNQTILTSSYSGGRIASDRFRHSLERCDQFMGLEEGITRYSLLLLVKKVNKHAGFSPRMIQLLEYYMAFTRDIDWEEGCRPIVYQSVTKTALETGVSERQIQKVEQQLFAAGAIGWNDSGNFRRLGQRDVKTGRIIYAFGIDLTPMAFLREELEQKLQEKQLRDKAWHETKRQISSCRRQIRSLIDELQCEDKGSYQHIEQINAQYKEIAIQLRSHVDLETLRSLLARHHALREKILAKLGVGGNEDKKLTRCSSVAEKTPKSSCKSVPKFAHLNYSNQVKNNCSSRGHGLQGNQIKSSEADALILATGLQHISLKQSLLASSERLRAHLPLEARPMNWGDITEAAYRLRPCLSISQTSWGEACELLGRTGGAICLLLTDQAMQRAENPVTKPAAYFRSLIRKARVGDLRLQNSVYGLLSK